MNKLVCTSFFLTLLLSITPSYAIEHIGSTAQQSIKLKNMKDAPATVTPANETESTSGLSGSVAFATNYVFRGISQTDNKPAVQGSLTYTLPIGVYANLWGSNVNFIVPDGRIATSEFDTIVGFRGSLYETFNYDLNVARYFYPGARAGNYNEFISIFNYQILQLGIAYTANYGGTHAAGTYYNGNIILPIPSAYVFNHEDLSLQFGMGHYSLAKDAGNSYNDYNVTLNKKFNNTFALSLQWTATNSRAQLYPVDRNQLLGILTASF